MTRRKIQRRKRIFLGCEGESEQGYGALLSKLAEDAGLSVHLVIKNLQPAGDPLALAEKAIRQFDKDNRKASFIGKAILLDTDRLTEPADRGRRALELLERKQFITIWQRPDHEGLLLRHFPGRERNDPPRGRSLAAIQAVWPGYRKNMAASDLAGRIRMDDVRRAAGVTPGLPDFLQLIGLNVE